MTLDSAECHSAQCHSLECCSVAFNLVECSSASLLSQLLQPSCPTPNSSTYFLLIDLHFVIFLDLSRNFQPSVMFASKARTKPTWPKHANITLGWRDMPGTNTPAQLAHSLDQKDEMFCEYGQKILKYLTTFLLPPFVRLSVRPFVRSSVRLFVRSSVFFLNDAGFNKLSIFDTATKKSSYVIFFPKL